MTRLVREKTPLADILAEAERMALVEALDQARGDRSEAARMLGLEPARLLRQAQGIRFKLVVPPHHLLTPPVEGGVLHCRRPIVA